MTPLMHMRNGMTLPCSGQPSMTSNTSKTLDLDVMESGVPSVSFLMMESSILLTFMRTRWNITEPYTHSFMWYLFFASLNSMWRRSSTPTSRTVGLIEALSSVSVRKTTNSASSVSGVMIFLASTALSHVLVRGREHRPTPERIEADKRFLAQLEAGDIETAITDFDAYRKLSGLEMGGRPLATMLGVAQAMAAAAGPLKGRQYGDYAQSSGSGNVVMALAPAQSLAQMAN